MTTSLKLGIFSFFLFQVLIAANFGLSHDEAYYWLFSRHLSWGYFDHPPFVAVMIRLFSFLPHSEIAVRLGFIGLQAGSLFLVLKILNKQYWNRAFLIFLSFPLASFSGLLALPDMPLLFMTAVYFYFLKQYLVGDKKAVIALGIAIAVLFYAKYHGILLIIFTIMALPHLLLRKDFWVIALLSLIFFSPHLFWQYENNFPTLRYHFLERPSSTFSVFRIFDYLGTQLILTGLFCGPVIWWRMIKTRPKSEFERALFFNSWGILIFFLVSTFSKKVEANWTISLAIPLTILGASFEIWQRTWAKIILCISFAIVVSSRLVFVIPDLPVKRSKEFHGWDYWASRVALACEGGKIVANTYQIASKLSFYLDQDIPALNLHSRKNQFDLWDWDISGDVCYITDQSGFTGEELLTPEKKMLKIVKNVSGEELRRLKLEEKAQKRDKP
jgi:4-amino-4-deoxy-L-arabinose transferase-like glycosyltransferase